MFFLVNLLLSLVVFIKFVNGNTNRVRMNYVSYKNHPWENKGARMKDSRLIRRLSPANPEPIRIKAYFGELITLPDNTLDGDSKNYMQSLVSAAIRYYESFLQVHRVSGNLRLHRDCNDPSEPPMKSFDTFGSIFNCEHYKPKCGDATIPNDHLRDDIKFDSQTKKATAILPGGNGIANADLILYVTYQPLLCNSILTIAQAKSCVMDQFGRPIAGHIIFCKNGERDWDNDVNVVTHEIMHVLGFSSHSFLEFRDTNGNVRAESDILLTQTNQYNIIEQYLTTPRVAEEVRAHFGCDHLEGARLEFEGGSHLHERYFTGEIMVPTNTKLHSYVSRISLAVLEDSGWYNVDYSYAEPYVFGKNGGCDFIDKLCLTKIPANDYPQEPFPEFFCAETIDGYGCSYDGRARTICTMSLTRTDIPQQFQYFYDSEYGGSKQSDYCPRQRNDEGFLTRDVLTKWYNRCQDTLPANVNFGNKELDFMTNEFGLANSRCVVGSYYPNADDDAFDSFHFCTAAQCVYDEQLQKYSSVNFELKIPTSNTVYTVECRDTDLGVGKEFISNTHYITCPDVNLYCVGSRALLCKFGHYDAMNQACICSYGWKLDTNGVCNTKDTEVLQGALPGNAAPPLPAEPNDVCFSGSPRGYFDGEYTKQQNAAIRIGTATYSIFKLTDVTNKYLYFYSPYRQWVIGEVIYDKLTESILNSEASLCDINHANPQQVNYCIGAGIKWSFAGFEVQYLNNISPILKSGKCPTLSPTLSPSKSPTKRPTLP